MNSKTTYTKAHRKIDKAVDPNSDCSQIEILHDGQVQYKNAIHTVEQWLHLVAERPDYISFLRSLVPWDGGCDTTIYMPREAVKKVFPYNPNMFREPSKEESKRESAMVR